MPASRLNPNQRARVRIDEMLEAAGWVILDYAEADFAAGPGVAVREFMTPKGPVDYLLVADGRVVGSIEAKKEGDTLRQVEAQADRYADGFEELVKTRNLPRYDDRLPSTTSPQAPRPYSRAGVTPSADHARSFISTGRKRLPPGRWRRSRTAPACASSRR